MMAGLPWILIGVLAATGIGMALISSLVGMRQKIENPAWWGLYAIWITIVLILDVAAPFRTILFASILAGLLHGSTQSLLLDRYITNNPWYAAQMQAPRRRLVMQFLLMGLGVGTVFGALVAGIAWGLARVFG
jgi:hypothetical protein